MFFGRPWSDWIAQYSTSHRNSINRLCHTVGIPLIVLSLLLAPVAIFVVGAVTGALLETGPKQIGGVRFDIHTLLLAGFACLIGYQLVVFAVFTKVFAMQQGFHPPNPGYRRLFRYIKLETGLATGALMVVAGFLGCVVAVISWQAAGFGDLNPRFTMREIIPAAVVLTLGVQTIFASFFLSILGIDDEAGPVN